MSLNPSGVEIELRPWSTTEAQVTLSALDDDADNPHTVFSAMGPFDSDKK